MTLDDLVAAGVLRQDGEGAWLLDVHAQPGARKTEPAGLHGERLKVRLSAPPVDGKANQALIGWVAGWFGVPRSAVSLVRGHTSRHKTVRVVT